jgi:PAS domain S-box-containing protein
MNNTDQPNNKPKKYRTSKPVVKEKKGNYDKKPDIPKTTSDSNEFLDLYKLISLGVIFQDEHGVVIHANPAIERIFGLLPGHSQGQTIIDPHRKIIHEDGSELEIDQLPGMVALRTGKPLNDVTVGVYDPNTEKYNWLLINAEPEFLPGKKKPYQAVSTVADITNLKNIVDTFGRYETLLNLAMVAADLGIWKKNFQEQQFFVDETTRRHFGFGSGQILTEDIFERIHPEDSERIAQETRNFLIQRRTNQAKTDFRIVHPDGTIRWVAINVVLQFIESDDGLVPFTAVGTSQDITERKLAEEALKRETRAFSILSSCDQAIIKITDEIDLLQEVCRICVESGDYRMAWIGYIENGPDKKIKPVAQFGPENGNLESLNITWSDTKYGKGPTSAAVRTNRPVVSQNILQDPRAENWREAAAKRGYASTIALPIHVSGSVIGVLTLYSRYPDAFESDEVALLKNLTDDLSYAIEGLRTRSAQMKLQEVLRISEESNKLAQRSAHIGTWEWNLQTDTLFWSDELYRLLDINPDEFTPTDTSIFDCVLPEDKANSVKAYERSFASGGPFDIEYRIRDSAGSIKWINLKGNVVLDEKNQPILAAGTMQEITERKLVEEKLFEANRNYRLVTENSNDVIWVLNIATERFTFISPSVKKLLGFSVEEMILKSLADILAAESYQKVKTLLVNSAPDFRKGNPATSFVLELDQYRKDKSIVTTEVTYSQVIDDEGNLQAIGITRDITERKKAEVSLKEERNLFQMLMNNIPDGIYFKNKESRFLRINKSEAMHFGLSNPSQAQGKTDFDFFSEEHARQAYDDEQMIIRTGQPMIDIEEKETWSDGRVCWVASSKLPLRNSAGEITGTFGISHDITHRKEMELSLQQRVKELETVYQLSNRIRAGETVQELLNVLLFETLKTINSHDGAIFLFKSSTNKLELCAASGWFEQLAGLTLDPDEGINGHVFSTNQPYITLEMQKDRFLAQKVHDLIPSQQYGGFFPIQCSEGIIGVMDILLPAPNTFSENDKRLLAIISQLAGNAILSSRLNEKLKSSNMNLQEEIDQRIAFQTMLAAEKELLSTTLMSIGEGVIIADKDGSIILFNHSAETITGFKTHEIIDNPLNTVIQIIDPITNQVVPDLIRNLYKMSRGKVRDHNSKAPLLITKSGERILVSASISALRSPKGKMQGHVLVFQDVTEQQKVEAQTALSQKMEAIGQLAAGIAHEINTPIQYVGDNLRFLQKTVDKFTEILVTYDQLFSESGRQINQKDLDQLDEVKKQTKIQHYLAESPNAVQEALDGVERVRKIVLAMREFSHPSDKNKKLSDINHGIETTIVISYNEWKYSAEMETDLDPTLPPFFCQIDEINQVILIMIINAAQAIQEAIPANSDQKGKIKISTKKGDGCIFIKIEDTGKGIPADLYQRIFDPFFTTKGIGKGTGQGLSLAHQIIVQKHHGTINVDSTVGTGTIFTIQLPIESEDKDS